VADINSLFYEALFNGRYGMEISFSATYNGDEVLGHPSGASPVHTVVAENYDVN
jgi:hypothetical protein